MFQLAVRAKLRPSSVKQWRTSHRVTSSIKHVSASRNSPNDASWKALSCRLRSLIFDLLLRTPVWIPAGYLYTPDTCLDTCRVHVYPWHRSGYLQTPCIPLTPIRIPADALYTPDTGQDTCRVPVYPWHLSGYLQIPCIPLTLVRIPAGYLHTSDTYLDTYRYPAGYLYTPDTGQDTREDLLSRVLFLTCIRKFYRNLIS